jgi:hypothetical protein
VYPTKSSESVNNPHPTVPLVRLVVALATHPTWKNTFKNKNKNKNKKR